MRLGVQGVGHRFSGRMPLFTNLTVHAEAGSLVGLIGPSGSGKSTLLALLGGYITVQTGVVVREGVETITWVFQNPVGMPRRSALDQVAYPAIAAGHGRVASEVVATEVMGRFGLAGRERSAFRELSGGEAQRLMLARAVVSEADAILIDEPTAQLDPHSARTVIEVIRGVAAPDRVAVVATHDQRLVERCDVVVDLGAL